MQKWDYLYVVVTDEKVTYQNGIPFRTGNHSLANFLIEAGKEGWELVGIRTPSNLGVWRLIFKRPELKIAEEHSS